MENACEFNSGESMSNLSNLEPFNILVKLTARALYGEIGDNAPNNRANSRAEYMLNVLTRYQWVRERDLVKDARVTVEVLQQILSFLHKEKLVKCEQKGEIVKYVARLHAAGVDAQHDGRGGDENSLPLFNKVVFHTYWCLDYGQIYSVARYKINCLKIKSNYELYINRRMQKHLCPNCKERYTMNAEWLFSDDGETVVSDKCHGQLVVESDKLVTQEVGGNVDDNVNCCEKLSEVLQEMEEQLMPLVKQLHRVQEMAVPDFGTLAAREVETKTIIIDEAKIPLLLLFKQMQNRAEIDAINRRVEELKLVKQVNSSNKKSKMDITSDPSGNKKISQEVQQGQDTKKQQDPSNVYNLEQSTVSDPQLGMKRNNGVDENIKEVTTPGTEEYYKLDLHIETREDDDDDDDDDWELVDLHIDTAVL
ncbi:uncharacterized protein LOC104891005 isoform X3 [Beta vulgaris subsp. vulgaris]|uniref:uncharacterized protein LOC104891005 isoform X3 n=1 Tax=Beta vulgaris subsp. vulgaris TaxID=3555 RepID=UPI0020370368|nr:uncharacterized protein LOC104891005 isoform X3 [Beta vulgaris subsp. vulgaris]